MAFISGSWKAADRIYAEWKRRVIYYVLLEFYKIKYANTTHALLNQPAGKKYAADIHSRQSSSS